MCVPQVRRRLDDLTRALEQCWLLLSCYLTLPSREERDDFLWSARTVVEKVRHVYVERDACSPRRWARTVVERETEGPVDACDPRR